MNGHPLHFYICFTDTFRQHEVVTLEDTIHEVLKNNTLLHIKYSTFLCTGLPNTGKTSFSHILLKKDKRRVCPGDHQVIFIKKENLITKKETDWKEIDINELIGQLNCITKLGYKQGLSEKKADGTVHPGIFNQLHQEIWSIYIFLDIYVPVCTIHLLPTALVTFVVDKFHNINISFKELKRNESSISKNICFLKHIITANCLKEYDEKNNLFQNLQVAGGKNMCLAFVGTCLGSGLAEATDIDDGLKCLLDSINSSDDEKESLSALQMDDGKLLHLIDVTNRADTTAEQLHDTAKKYLANEATYKVPVEWLLLLVELKQFSLKHNTPYIFFDEILKRIWKATHSSSEIELKVALKFFHHLNVLLYFEGKSNSESLVICCWKWLFKILNCLWHDPVPRIGTTFKGYDRFMYEGILNEKLMLDATWSFEKEIKMTTLIKLLEYLQLAVPIKRRRNTEYFMPCRLPVYEKSNEFFSEYGEVQLEPLLIMVSAGTSHPSLFRLLAAYLLETLPKNWRKPDKSTESKRYTYNNLITFPTMDGYYVTLHEKYFFLEIQVRKKSYSSDIRDFHYQVQHIITKALQTICLKTFEIKYGFLCKCDCVTSHMMVVKESYLCEQQLKVYCSKQSENQEFTIDDIQKNSL